jgi:glycosyltransferase involved in cell wall biosynthesis
VVRQALEPAAPVEISVVVPCFNSARLLPSLCDSLVEQRSEAAWEVVFVDNRSTDDTVAVASSYADRLPLRVVSAPDRAGAAYAMNVGAGAARGRALVFVGSDDEVAAGFVDAMADALREHGVVASRLDRETLNRDSNITWLDRDFQYDGLPYTNFLPYCVGSGMGIRAELFRAIGGFDPSLRNGEDVDLCWRLHLEGSEIHFEKRAVVRYRFRRGVLALYRQSREYGAGQVELYRRFGRHGMPRKTVTGVMRDWGSLASEIPRRQTRSNWTYWLNMLGFRVGRIRGSLRHRIFYL